MSTDGPLLDSLRRAVRASPEDTALRMHLAELLLEHGHEDEAITHLATVLREQPKEPRASELMSRALGVTPQPPENPEASDTAESFDWQAAEQELSELIPNRFTESDGEPQNDEPENDEPENGEPELEAAATEAANPKVGFDVERSEVRLADVGGMSQVKKRLDAAFLGPMRNPKLRKLFGKSLGGGLLLHGPPGCGKTFLAKAVAGELEARFLAVSIQDILDMWLGNSEKNVHELFSTARASTPCVIFIDELDAIGQKRSKQHHSATRGTLNQLLTELDGVGASNDGVFVLAATNHPWDIDAALMRPGRFDRSVAVLPPDEDARKTIFEYHLRDRPITNIKLADLAKRSDGYSGADIAHICEAASERALLDSLEADEPRMINMADLRAALDEITPSIGSWLTSARNVALYANQDGHYDDLIAYLKQRRML